MDIDNILMTNPSKISSASAEAEYWRLVWQNNKECYDKDEAKFVLELKLKEKNIKSTEIKYYVANNEDLFTQSNRNEEKIKGRPIIEFGENKYIFTTRSIIIALIGAPLLSYAIYYFFDWQANYWLHEIVVKQTVFFLNLLFNMGAKADYEPLRRRSHSNRFSSQRIFASLQLELIHWQSVSCLLRTPADPSLFLSVFLQPIPAFPLIQERWK